MLAADLQTDGTFEYKPHCATCNGTNAERVSIPNAVIMDALAAPVDDLDGELLANAVMVDERITARTALNPTPRRPSSTFGRQHLMQRAVDMVNARLIPFSPFGAHVNADGLRDRPIYREWLDRYLSELPDSSTLEPAAPETVDAATAAPEPVSVDPSSAYPVDHRAQSIIDWVGDDRDRAAVALDRETGRLKQRKSVLRHVNRVLDR